jgi:hypothetical protein
MAFPMISFANGMTFFPKHPTEWPNSNAAFCPPPIFSSEKVSSGDGKMEVKRES